MKRRPFYVIGLVLCLILLATACSGTGALTSQNIDQIDTNEADMNRPDNKSDARTIYLAGGCFWGVEAYFDKIPGILETESGYANGLVDQTSYRELGTTKHAETVKVVYDKNRIHLAEILERYYLIIEPFSQNKQGNDVGEQYRIGIYTADEQSMEVSTLSLSLFEERLGKKTVIELEPLRHFITAEEYHQNYLDKNPGGYCHVNLNLSDEVLYPGKTKPDDETLKDELSGLAYDVTQKKGTERPFTSQYDDFYETGLYVDVITGQPLFSSTEKYDANCGWPSFTRAITTDALAYHVDNSFGMSRIEVETLIGDNHLGHVFEDGPTVDGGLRYCMNGVALRFIPESEMKAEGYGALLPYLLP